MSKKVESWKLGPRLMCTFDLVGSQGKAILSKESRHLVIVQKEMLYTAVNETKSNVLLQAQICLVMSFYWRTKIVFAPLGCQRRHMRFIISIICSIRIAFYRKKVLRSEPIEGICCNGWECIKDFVIRISYIFLGRFEWYSSMRGGGELQNWTHWKF